MYHKTCCMLHLLFYMLHSFTMICFICSFLSFMKHLDAAFVDAVFEIGSWIIKFGKTSG